MSLNDMPQRLKKAASSLRTSQPATPSKMNDPRVIHPRVIQKMRNNFSRFLRNNSLDTSVDTSVDTSLQRLRQREETPLQRLQRREETPVQQNWYAGEQPTGNETLARIADYSQTNPAQGEQLYAAYGQYVSTPGTPFYNPYVKPTSSAVQQLAALGYGTENGVDATFFEKHSYLMNHYRTGASGKPLAPTSGSSDEQDAAYYFYNAYGDFETTQQADAEWTALQSEIAYWAGRSDLNLSYDEIVTSYIDWGKYPTLKRMAEGRLKGTPLELTKPIGYSQDAMQGVYWAAHNDGGTGSPIIDGVNYARGVGNVYVADPKISAKLNPGSEDYHPYVFGTTLNDAAVYFGVSHFPPGWTDANRADILGGTDETAKKNFYAVEVAEETTLNAEEEYAALMGWVDWQIANHPGDPSWLDKGLPSDYTTLKAMDEGRFNGKVVGLTRSVDYRWEDVEAYARQRYAAYEAAPVLSAYVQGVTETLGLQPAVTAQSQQGIDANRDEILHMAAPTLAEVGNEAEQRVFSTIGVSRFNDYAGLLSDAINSGYIQLPAESTGLYSTADAYAAENYTSAVQVLGPYREAVANRDAAQAELDVLTSIKQERELTEEEAAREKELEQTIDDSNATINLLQPDYDTALYLEQETSSRYDMTGRLAGALGLETPEGYVPMCMLIDEAYRLGGKYENPWGQYTALDMAMSYGASYEEVAAYARNDIVAARREAETCGSLRDEIVNRGGSIPQEWSDNLMWRHDKRLRDIEDSEYFLLRGEEGFAETAQAQAEAIKALPYNDFAFGGNEYSELTRLIAGAEVGIFHGAFDSGREETLNVELMTDAEKATYMYLVATKDEEAAKKYYDHLIDPQYGVIPVRRNGSLMESVEEFTRNDPIGANIFKTIMGLTQFEGVMYAGVSAIFGQRINPYHPAFDATNIYATVTGTSLEMIDETFKDSPVLADVIGFGYQALSNAADSVTSAVAFGPLSPTMMAVNAAAGAIADASYKGANNFELLAIGGIAALAERWTEKISFGDMEKAFTRSPKTVREFISTVGGNAAKEGATEAFSSLITTVSDAEIMGEASAWSRNRKAYMAEGMSPEDAWWSATFDMIYNIAYEGLIGAAAGGGQTVVSALGGLLKNRGKTAAPAEVAADTSAEGEAVTPAEPEYGLRHGHTRQDSTAAAPSQTQLSADRGNEPNPNQNLPVSEPTTNPDLAANAENAYADAEALDVADAENDSDESAPAAETVASGASEGQSAPTPRRAAAQPIARDVGEQSQPMYPPHSSGAQFVVPEDNAKQKAARNRLYAANKVLASAAGSPRRENKAAAMVGTLNALLKKGKTKKNPVEGAVIKLFERFGDDKTLHMMQSIAVGAAEAGVADADMASAVVAAAFEQSAAYEVLEQMVRENNYSRDAVELLTNIARRDWSNSRLAAAIKQDAFETRTARREMELISEGALDGIKAYETAYKQARANLATAQQNLETAQTELETAGQNLVTVQSQWVEQPSNAMRQGAVQQATKDVEGKVIVRNQMQQSVAKHEAQEAEAASTLKSQRERAMKSVREQAQQEVAAEVMAEEQAAQAANQPSQEGAVQSAEGSQAAVAEQAASQPSQEAADAKQPAKTSVFPALEVKNPPGGKPKKSAERVAKDLLRDIGVGDEIGGSKVMNRVGNEVLGYYERRAKYVAVRGLHAGDADVVFHEAGHAVADKIKMTGSPEMVAKLPPSFAAMYEASELPGEAFAEFFRRYMIAEEHARDFAGEDYVDAFKRRLRKANIDKPVEKAAIDYRRWASGAALDQLGAMIHPLSEKAHKPAITRIREVLNELIDNTSIAGAVNDQLREQYDGDIPLVMNLREIALWNNHTHKRAFNLLTRNLTDPQGNIIGQSLAQALSKIDGKDIPEFEMYWLLKHSTDRDAHDKPVFEIPGLTPERRVELISRMEADHNEFKPALEGVQKFRKAFLQAWLVDTAFMPQETLDHFNRLYKFYAPTQRVKEDAPGTWHKNSSHFQIRSATGSTEDIWSPLDSLYEMVNNIVTDVSLNRVGVTWHRIFTSHEGLGWLGEQISPDMKQFSMDMTKVQDQVRDTLDNHVGEDVLNEVLDIIGSTRTQWISTKKSTAQNSISVQLPDGKTVFYKIHDPQLFKLLTGTNGTSPLTAFGRINRNMALLTTGNNPTYAIPNVAKDTFRSIMYGSWATNPVTGVYKWVKTLLEIVRDGDINQMYDAMGGGGWTLMDSSTKKGRDAINAAIFKDYYKSNTRLKFKGAGKAVWETVTLAQINEVLEKTSKMAEFAYGKHDLSTPEGRMHAFNEAQNVTTDFARRGNGQLAAILRHVIPFFNANLQGVYQTARIFSKAERDRLPARLTKIVFNTGLMSALSCVLLLKFLSDDELEELKYLNPEMRMKYFYFPNLFGGKPWRIAITPDPIVYAIHGLVTNAIWYGERDEFAIDMATLGNGIVDSVNPFSNGTIVQPFIDVARNIAWNGASIVPPHLKNRNADDPTMQYTEETPDFFVNFGRALGVSPLAVQYVFEQYTGFVGQMVVPFISKDPTTGDIGGFDAVVGVVQRKFTSDPLRSTAVFGTFYDGKSMIESVVTAGKNGRPANHLRRGMTDEEAKQAYIEAEKMTSKDGILTLTSKKISEGYDEIEEINKRTDLTDAEKEALIRPIRLEMCRSAFAANEEIGKYREKYITGPDIVKAMMAGPIINVPTAYEMLDQTFLDDADLPYMGWAKSTFEVEQDANALPHPNTDFEFTHRGQVSPTKYEIGEEDRDEWNKAYRDGYVSSIGVSLSEIIPGWGNMSPEEQTAAWNAMTYEDQMAVLKAAHTAGHNAAKKDYKNRHTEIDWSKK